MVDQITPSGSGRYTGKDRTTRRAALWATVVALPLTVLVGIVTLAQLRPDQPVVSASPSANPSASAARPQSTAPVTMVGPVLAQRPAAVCRALLSQLPASLYDLPKRPVSAGPEQNAAYGDPAVTVACGTPPPSVPPTDYLWVVNGVCWHSVEKSTAAVLTTVDREVPVRVTLPSAYVPPLQWLAPLSESVIATVPSTKSDIPFGCTG